MKVARDIVKLIHYSEVSWETQRRAAQLSNGPAGARATNYMTMSTGVIPVTLPPGSPTDFAQTPGHY